MKRYIQTVDAVFALVLFCALALSMMLILTTGATAYQDIRDSTQNHYSENTCTDYIATKIRHFDERGGVYIGAIGSVPALCLMETFDGISLVTYIYYYDGSVREMYIEVGDEFDPEYGERIIEARALSFEVTDGGLIRVACTGTGGRTLETYFSPRSGEVSA